MKFLPNLGASKMWRGIIIPFPQLNKMSNIIKASNFIMLQLVTETQNDMAKKDDDNTGSGNRTLNDVMGSDKPSEEAGSGKTQVFNLDDIDIDEEIDISDMGEGPADSEQEEDFSNDDLEFGDQHWTDRGSGSADRLAVAPG